MKPTKTVQFLKDLWAGTFKSAKASMVLLKHLWFIGFKIIALGLNASVLVGVYTFEGHI